MVMIYSPVTGRHLRVSPGHLHWLSPQHRHRPLLPPHRCRTQITWDVTPPRRRLSYLWSPTHKHLSPAPLCFGTHLLRRLHTVLLSKMPPHNSSSQSFFLGASTPKTRWIARPVNLSMGMSVAPHFPNRGTSAVSTVSAAPATTVATFQSPVHCLTAHHLRFLGSKVGHSWEFHATSRPKLCLCVLIRILAPPALRRACLLHLPRRLPHSHRSLPPMWGTDITCSAVAHKRSASTALAGTHSAIGADPRAGRGSFPKPRPVVLPMVRFGLLKPDGHGYLHNADSDLMHHQYRLSILQWNPGPARRQPHPDHCCDLWTISCSNPARSQ